MRLMIIITYSILSMLFFPISLSADCNRGRDPEIGEWVSYSVQSNKDRMELKLSIVGSEKKGDKNLVWFELVTRTRELDFIIKRLIEGNPLSPQKVHRQIVKIINKTRPDYSPAIEVPIGDSTKGDDALKNFPCLNMQGEKKIYKHNKKEFNAYIIKTENPKKSLIIYSKDIPFFGVIKMESDNARIELNDYGKNASSEINEEPIRFAPIEEKSE